MKKKGVLGTLCGFVVASQLSSFADVPRAWRVVANPVTTNELKAITYGADQFVAVGRNGAVLVSTNGDAWRAINHFTDTLFGVAYGNGLYVAVGERSSLMAISSDGLHWTNRMTTSGGEIIFGVTYMNGRFVAVGQSSSAGGSFILTSTDGFDWLVAPPVQERPVHTVTFGRGRFVAVGAAGSILTSVDGLNWNIRDSGTTRDLRAIVFTGSHFIAGGDDAEMLMSTNGVFWAASAPVAFSTWGLASGDGAVVAVGMQGSLGRLHASTDGLGWPGTPAEFWDPLNAIAFGNGAFVAVGKKGSVVQSYVPPAGDFNSWLKPSNGNWEETEWWSRGELPSTQTRVIQITNAGYKAVAIGASTVANYPQSLTLRNLTVTSPSNSHNLLLLNWAGLSVPLSVSEDIFIGADSSLLSQFSAIQAGALLVQGGDAAFTDYGESRFNSVIASNGIVNLASGWFEAGAEAIAPGTWNQVGGTNQTAMLEIQSGQYVLSNGVLKVTANPVSIGARSAGELRIENGTADLPQVMLGSGAGGAEYGTIRLSGGLLKTAALDGFIGEVLQTGGTSKVGRITWPGQATYLRPNYYLEGGTLESERLLLGERYYGYFWQTAGAHVNSEGIAVNGNGPDVRHFGQYALSGGELVSPRVGVTNGWFWHTGGTNRAEQLFVTGVGYYQLEGGSLFTSNTSVRMGVDTFRTPLFSHAWGDHRIERNLSIDSGGIYDLNRGTLSVDSITIEAMGELRLHTGGIVSSNNLVLLRSGGFLACEGNYQLGSLRINGSGHLKFSPLSPSILRFRDAGFSPPALDGQLFVENWSGPAQSLGPHQLYVGNNPQAITPYMLELIRFVNPGGYPPGNYRARVKDNGEIVPLEPAPVKFTRSSNRMVLTWPPGYQLYSAPNVTGPYSPVSGATSPYNAFYTDPRRFFLLRPAP